MNSTLEARGLTKRFGAVEVLTGVDLTAAAGQITVIIGPNGAGKTTLFNCLSGVDPADSGTIRHRGTDVTSWSSDARTRHGLARTFQHASVFPTLTVADNLRVAAENHRRGGTLRGLLGVPEPHRLNAEALVHRTLVDLNLTAVAGERAGVLPSGTLRLVEVGRALCTRPDTLLLDEPASGLDDSETGALHRLLRKLADRNLALVMIEHDMALVHEAADVVYALDGGRVVASGSFAEVLGRGESPTSAGNRAP
jgi:branched-chain amino acid transport system ATP-binding protein